MKADEVNKEMLKSRRAMHKRLVGAGKSAKKAEANLKKAIDKYHQEHSKAIAAGKLLPMEKHENLLAVITTAQEALTASLSLYLEVEQEHKAYFELA